MCNIITLMLISLLENCHSVWSIEILCWFSSFHLLILNCRSLAFVHVHKWYLFYPISKFILQLFFLLSDFVIYSIWCPCYHFSVSSLARGVCTFNYHTWQYEQLPMLILSSIYALNINVDNQEQKSMINTVIFLS